MINKLTVAVLLSLGIASCSSFDSSKNYQQSEVLKPIKTPEGVASVDFTPLYAIPEINVKEEAFYNLDTDGFEVPRPEPMSAERQQAKVKIQKVGDRRWILAEASTSQIWPLAQNFLMQYDLGTSVSVPKSGLVVTDWVEFKDNPERRYQFRLMIEQGVREETTEIHAVERSIKKGGKAPQQWPEQSAEPAREEWVLMELANSLAGNIGDRAASLLGQSVGGQVKAELFMEGDEPAINLRLDRERAWATVAHAASKGEFNLWDEDSDGGVFFVQSNDAIKKRNWFLRLFLGERENLGQRPYTLKKALQHLDDKPSVHALFDSVPNVAFKKPLAEKQGLLLVLTEKGDNVVVKIRDASGNKLPLRENKKYLADIRRHLI